MTNQSEVRQRHQSSPPVALSVAAAVCGVLITQTLGATSGATLGGAVLGAAIPPMMSAVGPRSGLRVVVAIAVTAAALLLTYSGFTLFAYAANQPAALPLPPGVPIPGTSNPTIPPSSEAHPTPPAEPGIDLSPSGALLLRCSANNCKEPVAIRSAGTGPLSIGKIEIDGPNASDFQRTDQCEHKQLAPGQTCTFDVEFAPSGPGSTRHARLVINQNLPGDPSYLALEGQLPKGPDADLSVSTDGLRCGYQSTEITGAPTAIEIRFRLLLTSTNPDKAAHKVRITATSTSGLAVDYRVTIGGSTSSILSTATLRLARAHLGRTHVVTVTVDPGNEIPESNELNNRIQVTVAIPRTTTVPATPLLCGVERR